MNTTLIIGGIIIFFIILGYIMINKKDDKVEEKKAVTPPTVTPPTVTPPTVTPPTVTPPTVTPPTVTPPTVTPPKIDCVMSDWTPQWSNCTADCDGGKQYKSRKIISEPSGGGKACGDLMMEQSCNTQACVYTPEKLNLSANTQYKLAMDGDNNTFYTPSTNEEITLSLSKPKRITKIKLRYKLDPVNNIPISYNIFFFYNGQKNIAVSANTSNTVNKTGFVETTHNIINSNLIEKIIIDFNPKTDLYEVEVEGRDKN